MSMLDIVIPGKGKRLTDHTDRWMNILGRLRDGETIPQAEAGVAPLWHALRAEELKGQGRTNDPRFVADFLTHSRLVIEPGARGLSYSRSSLETPLIAVMAMAVLVLLLAAVNVSLLLVRAAGGDRSPRCAMRWGRAPDAFSSDRSLRARSSACWGARRACCWPRAPCGCWCGGSPARTAQLPSMPRLTRGSSFSPLVGAGSQLCLQPRPRHPVAASDLIPALKRGRHRHRRFTRPRRAVASLQIGLSVLCSTARVSLSGRQDRAGQRRLQQNASGHFSRRSSPRRLPGSGSRR